MATLLIAGGGGSSRNQYIDLKSSRYGVEGDGITNDMSGLKMAVADAIAQNLPLFVPPGQYQCNFESEGDYIDISDNFRIIGASRDHSIIKFGPEETHFGWGGFKYDANINFTAENLTISGPSTLPPSGNLSPNTYLVNRNNISANTFYDNRTLINNCKLLGKVTLAIQGLAGNGPWSGAVGLDIQNSDVAGWRQTIGWWCGYTDDNSLHYLHIKDSHIHDGGLTPEENEDGNGNLSGHIIYVHPNTSLDIRNSRFSDGPRYAIHWYGQSPEGSPKYANIENCIFDNDVATAILTSDRIHLANVSNCRFNNYGTAIQYRSSLNINNCYFNQSGHILSALSAYTSETEKRNININFDKCQFLRGNVGASFDYGTLRVSNSVFKETAGYIHVSNSGILYVDNCVFETDPNSPESKSIAISNGYNYINGCHFKNNHLAGTISFNQNYNTIEHLEVNNCTFLGDGRHFHTLNNGGTDLTSTLIGKNNTFSDGSVYWNEGNGGYQSLSFRECMSPTHISGSHLTVNVNYDKYVVDGDAIITGIDFQQSSMERLFNGASIKMILNGEFSLSGNANIFPQNLDARANGSVVNLLWDAPASTWREF